ncbi:hypothetical protein Hanom_Chr12g01074041 [Helianthus anomalus]
MAALNITLLTITTFSNPYNLNNFVITKTQNCLKITKSARTPKGFHADKPNQ